VKSADDEVEEEGSNEAIDHSFFLAIILGPRIIHSSGW
jgi:hypothetical protein